MDIKLEALDPGDTLSDLQTAITQFEQNGFQLITVAKASIAGKPGNIATFRFLAPGASPRPLTLIVEPGTKQLADQNTDLDNGETGGKQLISYAVVVVQGAETNVAAYRG